MPKGKRSSTKEPVFDKGTLDGILGIGESEKNETCPIAEISRQAAVGGYWHTAKAAIEDCRMHKYLFCEGCYPEIARVQLVRKGNGRRKCTILDIIQKADSLGAREIIEEALLDCIEIREYSVTIKDDCWKDCDVIMRLIQEYTGYSVNEIYHQCCDKWSIHKDNSIPYKDIRRDIRCRQCSRCR